MSDNPLFGRGGKHGQRSERKVAKKLGARQTPGSGAFTGHKGDMRRGLFLAEAKATVNSSARIEYAWLTKITQEAVEQGCDPLLAVCFVNGSGDPKPNGQWVMMPLQVFNQLNEKREK